MSNLIRYKNHKRCTRCQELKPKTEFTPVQTAGWGRKVYSRCRVCRATIKREQRALIVAPA